MSNATRCVRDSVERAEGRRRGCLRRRVHGTPEEKRILSAWPVPFPGNWTQHVNRPQTRSRRRRPAGEG